ncbi:MAG: YraN family protein [Prevotella sp.]|nr:YraN family protein [Prevotella sp.]
MAQHNETGHWGEEMAADFLRSKGYTIRDMNWRLGHRDIDVVALTPDMRTVVFVEVKTRTDDIVNAPDQAIDTKKIINLGYAANSYIKQNQIMLDVRFDIITIVGAPDSGAIPRIEHWEEAFNPMLAF